MSIDLLRAVESDVKLGSVPHKYQSWYPTQTSTDFNIQGGRRACNWTEFMKIPITHVQDLRVVSVSSTVQLRRSTLPVIQATMKAYDRKLSGRHLRGSRECHVMTAYLSTATMNLMACAGWRSRKPFVSSHLCILALLTLVS